MTNENKTITDEEKLKLVLELLSNPENPESICKKYNLSIDEALSLKEKFIEKSKFTLRADHPIIALWKKSLGRLLNLYEKVSDKNKLFFPVLFIFFLVLNISCYWFGVTTAFSELLQGSDRMYYFKIQFPVGFLGALFDSLSFYITIYIIRKALKTTSTLSYIGHLSIDLIIAMVATAWVLFVFWFSGWLISLTEVEPQQLVQRVETYENLVVEIVKNPWAGWRNIYFGIIMGFSTMIPSLIHISMFLRSFLKHVISDYKEVSKRNK